MSSTQNMKPWFAPSGWRARHRGGGWGQRRQRRRRRCFGFRV